MSAADLALVIAVRRLYQAGHGRQAREALGLSGGELARAAGIAVSALWHYENSSRIPRPAQALALARAFGCLTPQKIPDLLAEVVR
jgi:transcriptional regulator with XRE-family HTH domain